MKYCCEKCFSDEEKLRNYLIKNHEKTGTCDYCGEKNVKLIDVTKMRELLFSIINEAYYVVSVHDADCIGEDSHKTFYEYGGEPAIKLDEVLENMEDDFLADKEWFLNSLLYDDICCDPNDYVDVLYVRKPIP